MLIRVNKVVALKFFSGQGWYSREVVQCYRHLPLINMVVPPSRNVSQLRGKGVLDASTNTLNTVRSKPLLSKIGCIASLEKKKVIHGIGLDKQTFLSLELGKFSYQSFLASILCAQMNHLNEKVRLSTHNIHFG